MSVQEINEFVNWFKTNVLNTPETYTQTEEPRTHYEDRRPNIVGKKDYVEEPGLLEYIIGIA